jgi:hypothetical protein
VGKTLELLLRRGHDPRMGMADVQAADPAGEVDERVPVDVRYGCSPSFVDHDGDEDRERLGDHPLLAREDRPGAGPGDLGA